jgi:hypothetical protein
MPGPRRSVDLVRGPWVSGNCFKFGLGSSGEFRHSPQPRKLALTWIPTDRSSFAVRQLSSPVRFGSGNPLQRSCRIELPKPCLNRLISCTTLPSASPMNFSQSRCACLVSQSWSRKPITGRPVNLPSARPTRYIHGPARRFDFLLTHLQRPKIQECLDRGAPYWFFRYWEDRPLPDGGVKTTRKRHILAPNGPGACLCPSTPVEEKSSR